MQFELLYVVTSSLGVFAFDHSFKKFVFVRDQMCQFMADPGPCRGKISVFGYDPFMNSCNYFNYGGCGGNPNRFASYSDCHKACIMTRNIYEGGDKNKSEETDTSVNYYGEPTDEPENPDGTESPDSGEYGDGEDGEDGDGDGNGDGNEDGEDEDNQGETPEPDPEMEATTQNIEDVDGSNDYNQTEIMHYDIDEMDKKFNESVKEEIEQEYIDNLEGAKENDSEERENTGNEKGSAELKLF